MKFNNNFKLFIPSHLTNEKEVNLIIIQDGQFVFETNEINQGNSLELQHYIEKENLPVILLAIDNIEEQRFNQYCPYVSGEFSIETLGYKRDFIPEGDHYVEWIMKEIIPTIAKENQFKFKSITLAGISLGGLISLYALLKYPNEIDNIISVSGAYYINLEAMELLIDRSDLTKENFIYLDYGTTEVKDDEYISNCFIESNKRIVSHLQKQPVSLKVNEYENHEHDYRYFKNRMKDAVKSLF